MAWKDTGRDLHQNVVRYFGDYELLEEIARGGMGVVFKARQTSLNRIVAVKMILSGQLASPEDVQRFRTEAEAAAQLDHPGIVPIYEVGVHEGQHYFAMGFVEGASLAARVSDGPLPPREAAEIVCTVAVAVQYAHDHGVIHRDLKPGNVLLDKDGKPRVTDFGLAKLIENGSDLTGTGQILGTPSYMAPELAASQGNAAGPTVDVYALGAILYEMLTGRPPFRGETALETLDQVRSAEPIPPHRLRPGMPRELETICLKCLHKDSARRYAGAGALAEDLGRYLEGRPIQARPAGAWERLTKAARRHPAYAVLLGFSVLMIAAAASGIVFHNLRMQEQVERADENADQALQAKNRADDQYHQAWSTLIRMLETLDARDASAIPQVIELRRVQTEQAGLFEAIVARDEAPTPGTGSIWQRRSRRRREFKSPSDALLSRIKICGGPSAS